MWMLIIWMSVSVGVYGGVYNNYDDCMEVLNSIDKPVMAKQCVCRYPSKCGDI